MLFIDEVQDNSELQSALLFRLFTEGDAPVVRQRFGDANQAIYHNVRESEGATTDRFPQNSIRKDIPNSYRFGQQIADLANPFALEPQNLIGSGPSCHEIKANTAGKHAIFLFNNETIPRVMSVYAGYLQEIFSEEELRRGTFTAVGSVHRPGDDSNMPRSVGQYWPEYDYELTAAEPKPKTLFQYLMAGRRLARLSGEAQYGVEKVADGLLRLARISNPTVNLSNRKRKHRYVLELLAGNPEARAAYLDLVMFLAVEGGVPSTDDWSGKCSVPIICLAKAISGSQPDPDAARVFLECQLAYDTDSDRTSSQEHDNIFRYPVANPKVQIRVGSIHSVKGETHTATLVMETYYRQHHLATLKPWLLTQKAGKGKERVVNISRLKQLYVAMTRPSHLLCLAMREDAFTDDELAQLKRTSWRVARITDKAVLWL